ncbi:17819_t:CDS:2, partial [Funneliformis geosporum]
ENYLNDILTRNDIVAENNEGLTAILDDALSNHQEIPFMAIDNERSLEKINGKYRYILRLYSSLINGQRAMVTHSDIPVFFDILVPDGECADECETKVRDILSGSKTYLRIYTSSTGKRKTAMKAIQDNNYETASDNLYSFHHKVARENRIQLFGDHTLVFTWDIETQSQELGEFAKVLDLNQNVFMICITLHWKDDPKPLKNQENLLKAFTLCWRAFVTDIQKYREKIGAKSENIFKKKNTVKAPEEGEEDLEENEYMGGPIKIKISAEDDFTSSFLKLPDALCCQDLLVNQSIINDYREIASIAYVSLFDVHYRANRMKVQNLLSAYAVKRDMVINTRRPVTELDFASLYPSIIMVYNLSPEKFIFDPKDADIAQNNENNLYKIEFSFNKHIVQACCICHDSQMEKKGLYLGLLEDLFNKRLKLKARLAPLGKKKQHLGKMISLAKERGKRIPESLNLEYSSICFDYDYWDLNQKALKLYMNTFYEEAGNSKSPIFLHELAYEIIIAGKTTLILLPNSYQRKGLG